VQSRGYSEQVATTAVAVSATTDEYRSKPDIGPEKTSTAMDATTVEAGITDDVNGTTTADATLGKLWTGQVTSTNVLSSSTASPSLAEAPTPGMTTQGGGQTEVTVTYPTGRAHASVATVSRSDSQSERFTTRSDSTADQSNTDVSRVKTPTIMTYVANETSIADDATSVAIDAEQTSQAVETPSATSAYMMSTANATLSAKSTTGRVDATTGELFSTQSVGYPHTTVSTSLSSATETSDDALPSVDTTTASGWKITTKQELSSMRTKVDEAVSSSSDESTVTTRFGATLISPGQPGGPPPQSPRGPTTTESNASSSITDSEQLTSPPGVDDGSTVTTRFGATLISPGQPGGPPPQLPRGPTTTESSASSSITDREELTSRPRVSTSDVYQIPTTAAIKDVDTLSPDSKTFVDEATSHVLTPTSFPRPATTSAEFSPPSFIPSK